MEVEVAFNRLRKLYDAQFKQGNFGRIERSFLIEKVFTDVVRLFRGEFEGYQACDTKYHDLRHTLEATLVMVEILVGMNKKGVISRELFELGIVAVLLHDAGFIKKQGDKQGSGAKYTFEHVEMSAEFAEEYLAKKGYNKILIAQVQNIIRCTGAIVDLKKIEFKSEEEKKVGAALGSADLLGQMAADNYLDKLPLLFEEFSEAYDYEGGIERVIHQGAKVFRSVDELIKETPAFWKHVFEHRLPLEFNSVFKYLDPAVYQDLLFRIEINIGKIKENPILL